MDILYYLITMTISGSMVYILFKVGEIFTKRYFSATWHYRLLKFILLFFILPLCWISQYLKTISKDVPADPNVFNIYIIEDGWLTRLIHLIKTHNKWIVGVWLLGVGILLLKQIISYIKFKYIVRLNKREPKEEIEKLTEECAFSLGILRPIQIYVNEYINTPMLIGIMNPMILIPTDEIQGQYAEYILSHELTHYKKKDVWFKFLMLGIRIIHWFNPMVYLMSRDMDKWCEYACDEDNAIDLTMEMKKQYGLAILNAAASVPVYGANFGTPLLLPKQNLKERLMFMLKVKKMKPKTIIMSVILGMVLLSSGLIAVFFGNMEYNKFQQIARAESGSQDVHDIYVNKEYLTNMQLRFLISNKIRR